MSQPASAPTAAIGSTLRAARAHSRLLAWRTKVPSFWMSGWTNRAMPPGCEIDVRIRPMPPNTVM